MEKIKISSELTYLFAIVLLSLAVAMLSAADFGISMIVAPAYLLSLKIDVLSFGQAEYVIQAGVFIILCVVLKKFKFVYLFSFGTCLIYGLVLDFMENNSLFQSADNRPRQYGFTDQNSYVRFGRVVNVVCRGVVFQNISLSAGLRLFRKSRFGQLRNKITPFKNDSGFVLPYGKFYHDSRFFR